jgi:2-polyprenyl-6-methoxyphenol hydroxylase-like FAD-dependent oxidoreductase
MSHTFSTDVVVCGAGAAGLTLAIDLARRYVAFSLIDKADGPFRGARGKAIQPRSQEVFEDLGIVDRVVAAGGRYPPQRVYRDDGSYDESPIMLHRDPTPNEPYAITVMVPQFLTEAAMRERLAELGHCPQYGVELIGFVQDAESVSARISRASGVETLRARYLVGADGGGSLVRHALDIGFPGKSLDIRAVVADVSLEGLGRDDYPTHRPKRHPDSFGVMGFGLQYECTPGGSLSVRTRVPGRRCCSHPSTNRRTRAQYQCAGFLQSRLEARCGSRRRIGGAARDLRGGTPPDCRGDVGSINETPR